MIFATPADDISPEHEQCQQKAAGGHYKTAHRLIRYRQGFVDGEALQMATTTTISPEQVKTRILEQLLWDNRLDASDIQVDVRENTVHLNGSVPTFQERRLAEEIVLYTPGVSVVRNELAVKYPKGITLPSDADIESNIRNIFFLVSSFDASRIQLSVRNGTVTLDGSVDNYWQKLKAEELAADVAGVIDIHNRLAVVPTETYHDEAIAKDVIAALERNVNVDARSIDIEVENGTVTLSGTVPDWTSLREAENTALYTGGVTAVNNNLAVKPSPEE